ncbi:M12 family metallo-peptidase [Sphingobacterium lactis]|uniref:M12 family metallo-peptidase n=1 Tax=Sphingobacterium lactis TaxID=797291 RepID=UPI003F813385
MAKEIDIALLKVSKSLEDGFSMGKILRKYEIHTCPTDLTGLIGEMQLPVKLRLIVGGEEFLIDLVPNDLRSGDYISYIDGQPDNDHPGTKLITTFKGTISKTDDEVRLSIFDDQIRGFIQVADEKLFIDSLEKVTGLKTHRNTFITYSENDVINLEDAWCGVTDDHEKKMRNDILDQLLPMINNCRFLKVATDADFEFFQRNGTNTNLRILGIFNNIEALYQNTFNVTIRVVFQNVWQTVNDPYTGDPTTQAGSLQLVNELRNYWNANFQQVSRDVVHLFTGRGDLSPFGVYGIVYEIGSICRAPDKSYGFTRERFNEFLTTAHELGHNFGGIHTDGINCGTSTASIMCQGDKSVPMYFSVASISRIGNFINSNSFCLVPERLFWITGPDVICGNQLYTLANIQPGDIVSWTVSPGNLVQLSPSGQGVMIIPLANGTITLTATLTGACTDSIVISKALEIGIYTPDVSNITVQRNGPGCVGNDYQPISFGIVYNGSYGCSLANRNIAEVEWQLFLHGQATPQIVNNAGYYNCPSNDVINPGITIGFGNFSSPFMITLLFRVRNKCGVWSDYSPGFSFQIRRC